MVCGYEKASRRFERKLNAKEKIFSPCKHPRFTHTFNILTNFISPKVECLQNKLLYVRLSPSAPSANAKKEALLGCDAAGFTLQNKSNRSVHFCVHSDKSHFDDLF